MASEMDNTDSQEPTNESQERSTSALGTPVMNLGKIAVRDLKTPAKYPHKEEFSEIPEEGY